MFRLHKQPVFQLQLLVTSYEKLADPNRVPAGYEIVGRVYAGKYFGELVYCSNQMSYHTYTKVDNKLFVSNGDIFTITSSGLIKDGSSKVLSKYDPSKRF